MNEYIHGYTFFRVMQYFELTDNYFRFRHELD